MSEESTTLAFDFFDGYWPDIDEVGGVAERPAESRGSW
jgi:hypothetical protein